MTTQHPSASRTRLPILIAAWLFIIAATVTMSSGLPGAVQAETERGAIPSLTLESSKPGQMVIIWETPEPTPTDYRVRWSPTNAKFLSYKDDNEAERGNLYPLSGVNTLTVNNLTPGEEYKVHMRSRYYEGEHSDSQWSGPWTQIATQRVKDHPPAEPTGLTASQVEHNSLTLSWDDPQDTGITGYRILRGADANSLTAIEEDTGSAGTEYTDTTVEPETIYHYAILAMSQDGDGAQSAGVSITTIAEPVQEEPAEEPVEEDPVEEDPPAAPTGLTTSQVSHNALTLSWDDPQDTSITGYRILRGPDAGNLAAIQNDMGSASTEYTDATVEPETTYHYAILALSQDGDGAQSPAISITTPAEPVEEEPVEEEPVEEEPVQEEPVEEDPPAAPTDLTASNVAHNSLTLSWNDPQDDSITGYRILRGDAYKNLPTIEEDTQSSTPSYTDNTVGQASAYFYQVVPLRADGESQKSITIDVTTPAESIRSVPQRSTAPATQTLVSNTDRATVSMANLITQDLAQEFTTGPNPTGYKLSSIDLYLTGRGTDLTVKLFSGSATGSEVATLTSPGWDTTCIRSFLPPTPI